eukprot:CAMPEP_0197631416 /NCGR_PEP_ID=MMETSP1338-20131121/8578_1 /TAXON_ID=43686 ORGANISM="Pelagodinium beii, Strain RCC1491" /NCGR_SAMPLE_ID=MMETSP1338 /ASSEMBLY_ACC=CAM_ASM_000754 /LENGTH=522 /DNA_ID=CAMNT_0043202849 /DNA_START=38 /DNA_END=1604 /DNA_ORIENTATION=+
MGKAKDRSRSRDPVVKKSKTKGKKKEDKAEKGAEVDKVPKEEKGDKSSKEPAAADKAADKARESKIRELLAKAKFALDPANAPPSPPPSPPREPPPPPPDDKDDRSRAPQDDQDRRNDGDRSGGRDRGSDRDRYDDRDRGRNNRRDSRDRGRDEDRERKRYDDRDRVSDRDRRDDRDRQSDRRDGDRDRRSPPASREEQKPQPPPEEKEAAEQPRKRKSKWGDQAEEGDTSGIPDWLKDQFASSATAPVNVPGEPQIREGQRKVKVPQLYVSRVLGTMGAIITNIQDQSNTDIKMDQTTRDNGYSFAIITSLMKVEKDLDKAETLILEILNEAQATPRVSGVGTPLGDGLEKREFTVSSSLVGSLIGKGGETIKAMQIQAGCQIGIDQKDEGDPEALVSIGPGSAHQVALAEKLVRDKITVKNRGPPILAGMGLGPGMFSMGAKAAPPPVTARAGLGPGMVRPAQEVDVALVQDVAQVLVEAWEVVVRADVVVDVVWEVVVRVDVGVAAKALPGLQVDVAWE